MICNECVMLCVEIIENERREQRRLGENDDSVSSDRAAQITAAQCRPIGHYVLDGAERSRAPSDRSGGVPWVEGGG